MKKNIKIRVNKEKLKELNDQLKPATSIWALFGIIFFFFVPEMLAFFWGKDIKAYFEKLALNYKGDFLLHKLYLEAGDMLSENSIFNIILGIGFVYWWYYERKKSSQN